MHIVTNQLGVRSIWLSIKKNKTKFTNNTLLNKLSGYFEWGGRKGGFEQKF